MILSFSEFSRAIRETLRNQNRPAPLRVRPETSRWIAEFSEHEAD
jgi:hypothetical protein